MPAVPPFNFAPEVAPYMRWLERRVTDLETAAGVSARDTLNSLKMVNSSITQLNSRVKVLSAQAVQYFASNNNTYSNPGVTGWLTAARPSVQMSSPTGRIKVGFGAAANGGNGIVGFSIVDAVTGAIYVDKTSFAANPAAGVYVSGGASFTPTGFKSTIVAVPADTPLTITLEMNANDTFVFFFGPNILVEVAN